MAKSILNNLPGSEPPSPAANLLMRLVARETRRMLTIAWQSPDEKSKAIQMRLPPPRPTAEPTGIERVLEIWKP